MATLRDGLLRIAALRDDGCDDEEIALELGIDLGLLRSLKHASDYGSAGASVPDRNGSVPVREARAEAVALELEARLREGPGPGEAAEAFREMARAARAGAAGSLRPRQREAPSRGRLLRRISEESMVERLQVAMARRRGARWDELPPAARKMYAGLAGLAVAAMEDVEREVASVERGARVDRHRA